MGLPLLLNKLTHKYFSIFLVLISNMLDIDMLNLYKQKFFGVFCNSEEYKRIQKPEVLESLV